MATELPDPNANRPDISGNLLSTGKPPVVPAPMPAPAPVDATGGTPKVPSTTVPSASTGAPDTSVAANPVPSNYTVSAGDTLASIAQKNGTNIQALMGANPSITNPSVVKAGTSIVLPGGKTLTTTPGKLGDVSKAVYAAVKAVPDQNNAGAVTQAGTAAAANLGATDPISAALAPYIANMTAAVQAILTPTATHASLTEEYAALASSSGLDSLNTQMMNLTNVMSGTKDDIRTEITASGGFASDSQVQAMATARNNVIIKQYNALATQYASAKDYVTNTMQYETADQSERDTQQSLALTKINDATGIETTMAGLQQTMMTNAAGQYKDVVTQVGYSGLASIVAGNPYQQSLAEVSLGLPQGTLSNPTLVGQLATKTQSAQLLSAAKAYFTQNGEWPSWYNPATGQLTGASAAAGAGASGDTTPDSSANVIGGIDFGNVQGVGAYATDVGSEVSGVSRAYNDLTSGGTDLSTYIKNNAPNSPVTADMINTAATKHGIDPNILAATLMNESQFGTTGAGAKTMNPGNVGNTGDATQQMPSWEAGVEATAHQLARRKANTTTSATTDPTVQAYVDGIKNGTITSIASVPKQYKSRVAIAMSDQAITSPLSDSRYTMAANRIVNNFIALPQYQLTANGLPYLQRIAAAMKTPGSISDQDLLDSLTKLNTSGNAISDAQVKLITDGQSFADTANVWGNKLKNGGVLSDSQRTQITKIASAIYDNYKTGYQPVYDQATAQLKAAGIPEAYWTIPDLNSLSAKQTGAGLKGPKGSQSDQSFVESSLDGLGISYKDASSNIPSGEMGVVMNDTGQFGYIPQGEFDPSVYTSI